MYAYALLAICMLCNASNTVLSKKFQIGFPKGMTPFFSYNFINALFAILFLGAANAFRISFTLPTMWYALGYAAIVFASLMLSVLSLAYMTISTTYVLSTSGSVILSALFGWFVLEETAGVWVILSVLFMLGAVLLSVGELKGSGNKIGILIGALHFLNSGSAVIVTKLYSNAQNVSDEKSFFLLTNAVLALLCGAILFVIALRRPMLRARILKPFSLAQTANIGARTALSNVSSVCGILAIAQLPLAVYSVSTSAFGLIAGALLSCFFFHEPMKKNTLGSVLFAVIAVILAAF